MKRRTFIDLFSGCGGLSLGLIEAGWKGSFAVEVNPDAFLTFRQNLVEGPGRKYRHEWPEWLPVAAHNIRSVRRKYRNELRHLRGQVTLVAGGPPCQGFSTLGRRDASDARNSLLDDYVSFVNLVQPKFILLENVVGIKVSQSAHTGRQKRDRQNESGASRVIRKLERNYQVNTEVLRASHFGVAQNRPRFIAIGVRRDLIQAENQFDMFGRLEEVKRKFLQKKGLPVRPIKVKEAISDLETRGKKLIPYNGGHLFKQINYRGPRTEYQRLLHGSLNGSAPNSLRLANHNIETQRKFRKVQQVCEQGKCLTGEALIKSGVRKGYLTWLSPDKPAHTISTLPDDLLHYSEPRILTVRENARLQSFPDWFEFHGKYTTGGHRRTQECPRYTQVGNAVAPFFAEFLGHLLIQIDKDSHER